MHSLTTRSPGSHKFLVITAVAVLLIKLAQFSVDATPLFFMGDSATYITSAIKDYVPAAQAGGYSHVVRWFAVWPGTLTTLVLAQTMAGAITAWLAAFILLRYFSVRPPIAILIAILYTIEPLQIVHEHLIMAEVFTQLLLAVHLLLILSYVRRPRSLSLVAICGVGIVLVSFRVVYVALALSMTLLPLGVALAQARAKPFRQLRWPVRHLTLAIIVTVGLHFGYRQMIGAQAAVAPTYIPHDSYAILAAWGPLITPEDASDPRARQVIEQVLAEQHPSLRDRFQREWHRWQPGGLVARLTLAFGGDDVAGTAAARNIVTSVFWRNPLAIARLVIQTYVDHWRLLPILEQRLRVEQGSINPLGASFEALLREQFGLDATNTLTTMTPSKRYHLAGRPWYILLLVAPVIILLGAIVAPPGARLNLFLLMFMSLIQLLTTCSAVHLPYWRYLMPLTLPTLLAIGVMMERLAANHHRSMAVHAMIA